MKNFELCILGSNSALPAYGRFPTSQVLNYNGQLFLIDCGEGTQMRMSEYKIKRNRITHIFISHLHGDHLYGLPGVVTSMNHMSRKHPLFIYGPVGIKKYLDTLIEIGEVHLNFDLHIQELTEPIHLYENVGLEISCFEVFHRIPTYGFRFQEKLQPPNLNKDAINKYNLTIDEIKNIKSGGTVDRISDIELTEIIKESHNPRSYCYCADSKTDDRILEYVKDCDLLYFETTYLDELENQAVDRGHATARQAAIFAKKANAKKLVTGHYSSRYKDVKPIVEEAKSEFSEVIMGYDGAMISL